VAGTAYPSNGFIIQTMPMITGQFDPKPFASEQHARPRYHLFSRGSLAAGRLRCMSISQAARTVTWCVTRTGVPALLYGNHGIPASFDSMQLISVGPPSPLLLEPFGRPVSGDALTQVVR
jgi:hypothetical protein